MRSISIPSRSMQSEEHSQEHRTMRSRGMRSIMPHTLMFDKCPEKSWHGQSDDQLLIAAHEGLDEEQLESSKKLISTRRTDQCAACHAVSMHGHAYQAIPHAKAPKHAVIRPQV